MYIDLGTIQLLGLFVSSIIVAGIAEQVGMPKWAAALAGFLACCVTLLAYGIWNTQIEQAWKHYFHKKALLKRPRFKNAIKLFSKRNYQSAYKDFIKRAENGDPEAQYNAATLCEGGMGVSRSDKKAEYWYRKAASAGVPESQFHLAALLVGEWVAEARGEPIPRQGFALGAESQNPETVRARYIEAYKWALLARRQNFRRAKTAVRRIKKQMSPTNIALAEQQAKEFDGQF